MIECSNVNEFISLISTKNVLIYGAGYVASTFLEALKKYGLDKKIQGFIVTQIMNEQHNIDGIPVRSINHAVFNDEALICIAVHEAIKDEIEMTLCNRGISNFIWIYPFLYELHLGKPIVENEWINTKDIISDVKNHYALAVRWAAIDDYYGKLLDGFYLYKKALRIHAGETAAEARVQKFRKLIHDWEVFGYQDKWQIAINDKYEIIDGEHRVSLALYHDQPQIRCKIYEGQNMHGDNVLMTRKALIEGSFTQEDIEKLDAINFYIRKHILEEEV